MEFLTDIPRLSATRLRVACDAHKSEASPLTELLIRLFVKNRQDIHNHAVRAAYGTLGTCTGIGVNVLLALLKFLVGLMSGSLAVMADAANNLSDGFSSIEK